MRTLKTLIYLLTLADLILISHQFAPKYEELPWKPLTTDLNWINEAIAQHNVYRAKHGACPLVLNLMLCEISQGWADQLSWGARDGHSNNILDHYVGENVFIYRELINQNSGSVAVNVKTSLASSTAAVDDWYNEINDYDFTTGLHLEGHSDNIGHFTQVVWKNTHEVGLAFSAPYTSEKDGVKYKTVAVVASYYPSGNEIPHFTKNVVPAGGSSPSNCPAPREQAKVRTLKAPAPASDGSDSQSTGTGPVGPKAGSKAAKAMEEHRLQKLATLEKHASGVKEPGNLVQVPKKPVSKEEKQPVPEATPKLESKEGVDGGEVIEATTTPSSSSTQLNAVIGTTNSIVCFSIFTALISIFLLPII